MSQSTIDPKDIPYGVGAVLTTDSKDNIRTLTNPLKKAYTFKWGGKEHTLKAGETKPFVEYLALHGAKHLSAQILFEKGQLKFSPAMRVAVMKEILDKETSEDVKKRVRKPKTKIPAVLPQSPTEEDVTQELENMVKEAEADALKSE